jgi:hypothetical protein
MNQNSMNKSAPNPPTKRARSEKDGSNDEGKQAYKKNETQIEAFKLKEGEKWDSFCGTCTESKPDWPPRKIAIVGTSEDIASAIVPTRLAVWRGVIFRKKKRPNFGRG